MSAVGYGRGGRVALVREEVLKLPAFLRRDLLVTVSYRVAFIADLGSLFTQALLFFYVGKLVDPASMPVLGDTRVTYLEFVAVGIALGVFVQLGLGRVSIAFRQEQLLGTLESMLLTPTALSTIQLGSVAFDLVYVPLRTFLFLGVMAGVFDFGLRTEGLLPTAVVLLAFIPFVWGLGVLSAAAILTFKRGAGLTGIAGTFLTLGSGAYFPLDVLPGWVSTTADLNAIAVALEAARDLLLGDAGWGDGLRAVVQLAPFSGGALLLGVAAFHAALRRERRRGTVGFY